MQHQQSITRRPSATSALKLDELSEAEPFTQSLYGHTGTIQTDLFGKHLYVIDADTVLTLLLVDNLLISGSQDCSVRVWDVGQVISPMLHDHNFDTSQNALKNTLIGHQGAILALAATATTLYRCEIDHRD